MSIPDVKIHPHATGAAAETVAKHQTPQDLVFWAGWVRYDPVAVPFRVLIQTWQLPSSVHMFSVHGLP